MKLHDPTASVSAYKTKATLGSFKTVMVLTNQKMSVNGVMDDRKNVVARYSLNGLHTSQHTKSLNIVRMSDGTTRKVAGK